MSAQHSQSCRKFSTSAAKPMGIWLATLAEANCLVIVPSEAEQVRTGEIVDVAVLAQRG